MYKVLWIEDVAILVGAVRYSCCMSIKIGVYKARIRMNLKMPVSRGDEFVLQFLHRLSVRHNDSGERPRNCAPEG